jgi:hypothetical protein
MRALIDTQRLTTCVVQRASQGFSMFIAFSATTAAQVRQSDPAIPRRAVLA